MSPTKLPALWRRSAYAVAAAEDNDNSRNSNRGQILGLVPGLGAALENGSEIVIRVASSSKTDDFNRVNVRAILEFYARGTLVGAYACNNFSDAVNMAERFFGPHLPNCLIYTGSQDETRRDLEFTSAADLLAEEAPVLSWHVLDLLPAADVTLLFGDGGTGKSLAALQLAACTVARRPWFGLEPAGGPTVFISAEDGRDEIHRRLRMICAADHIDIAELSELRIRSMVGEDALLGIFNPDTRMIEPTAAYDAIERMVKDTQPALLVLDTLADLFGGDENVRSQARQFIALLRRLTIPCGTTILCLAHPSVAGMNSGTGVSGSTGWSNSVRSRLYLERIKEWRGKGDNRKLVEPDVNARLLTTKKANYTKAGETIRIRWQDGVLKRHDVLAIEDKSAQRETAEEAAERVDAKFLDLLAAYTAEGRSAGPSPSSSYAPTLFAKDERSAKITKAAFAKSMNRLLASGRIEIETYGSAARNAKRLAINTSDVPSEPSDPPSDGLQT